MQEWPLERKIQVTQTRIMEVGHSDEVETNTKGGDAHVLS
jgi:hypothetical protein